MGRDHERSAGPVAGLRPYLKEMTAIMDDRFSALRPGKAPIRHKVERALHFAWARCRAIGMVRTPKPYPSDVTDEEWALVAPYLTLMREDTPQREH